MTSVSSVTPPLLAAMGPDLTETLIAHIWAISVVPNKGGGAACRVRYPWIRRDFSQNHAPMMKGPMNIRSIDGISTATNQSAGSVTS